MSTLGSDLSIEDLFNVGIPFKGPLDVKYFTDLPNEATTRAALKFMSDQNNEFELRKRHVHSDIVTMWKAVFRACLTHNVEIPAGLTGYAKRLGVVLP